MDYREAEDLFRRLGETSQAELWSELLRYARDYAQVRAEWFSMDHEERRLRDASRTAAHNAFIDSCNILSRAMAKAGESNAWRADLGDDRKTLGDFACFLHCIMGLESR